MSWGMGNNNKKNFGLSVCGVAKKQIKLWTLVGNNNRVLGLYVSNVTHDVLCGELPPVKFKQLSTAAGEAQKQILRPGGATDRATYVGPRLPAPRTGHGAGADERAGGGAPQTQLHLAPTASLEPEAAEATLAVKDLGLQNQRLHP